LAEIHQPEGTSFHTLTTVLRRRWWVFLLALLVPAAALGFSLSQAKEYTSSASVLFRDVGASSVLASEEPEREAATNVELLSLDTVKNRVERRLGGSGKAAGKVSVVQEGQSNVLTIKVESTDPRVAARTANAYALEYVRFRRQAEETALRQRDLFLRSELRRVPAFGPGSDRGPGLRQQIRELKFESASTTRVARVVSAARPAGKASSPKPVQNTILAGLLGLFLAGIAALIFERLDPRLTSPKEAEAIFDRPLLGVVHRSRALSRPVSGKVPAADFDNFLALRAYLRFVGPKGNLRSVLVTSAASGDGKTTVAWNLACAAATPERRVLLVEADVRAPTLAGALKIAPESGLSNVLAGQAELGQVTREVAIETSRNGMNGHLPARIVSVVFAGPTAGATYPAAWERLGEVLRDAEHEFDLIVVDTAPLISVPDAVPLISHIGGVIVIGRIGNTPRAALARLKDQLDTVDAPMVGVVVNSVGKDPEYGYGYGYQYTRAVTGPGLDG
jgi:capsular exopolysaccharide synthesis family protein